MKTKLAKETLLNQTKSELIEFLIQKNRNKSTNDPIECYACGIGLGGF